MRRTSLIVFITFLFLVMVVKPCSINEPIVPKETVVKHNITPSRGKVVETKEEKINGYIREICSQYNMEPAFVQGVVYYESTYKIDARNGNCVGLMQINKPFHLQRAQKLGVTDFYDPYSNILLGVDYLSELFDIYKDQRLVLKAYRGELKGVN